MSSTDEELKASVVDDATISGLSPTGRSAITVPETDSPYFRWLEEEGLTPLRANHVPDLRTVELEYWKRVDVLGKVIVHGDTDRSNDSHLMELRPQQTLAPQRHLFDKMVYVVSGHGNATVWNDRGDKETFRWKQGGVFAIPMNAWYSFTNESNSQPARLEAVTNAPIVLNLFDDVGFVFDTKHDFLKRFAGEPGYFSGRGELEGRLWNGHHVQDAHTFDLIPYPERGAGGGNIKLRLARSAQHGHISQFPVGTYKKAHRHGPGAHVIVLSGEGFTLMWKEGNQPERYDWSRGSLVVPPENWFHQHFNTGAEPARYLALRHAKAMLHPTGVPLASVSTRLGGDQIEYDDEAPFVRETYLAALERNGVEPQMPNLR